MYMRVDFTGSRLSAGSNALGTEARWQLDARPAPANPLAQIARAHFAVARKLDRGNVRIDGAQAVTQRTIDQFARPRRIGGDCGLVEVCRPSAVQASINHRTVADTIGRDHDGPGDFDFLLQRRGHRSPQAPSLAAGRVTEGRTPAAKNDVLYRVQNAGQKEDNS